MTIQTELVARLEADGTLSDLISDRIYPQRSPVESPQYPLVTYSTADDLPTYAMSGPTGDQEADITFDCVSETYSSARAVSAALVSSLTGFSGTLGALFVKGLFIESVRDGKYKKSADEDSLKYLVNVLIKVHYE